MKKLFFLSMVFTGLLVCTVSFVNAQGVGINSSGTPADNSAGLDVNFNNKGLLIPRMTIVERDAIDNPATGLQIYNSDCNTFNFNAGTPSAPDWVTVNSSNALVAGVSIFASPAGAICAGTSVTFVATPASGINSPVYQWKVNGENAGTNSSNFITSSLNNGDVVSCILTSNAPCVTGSPASSNSITVTVNPIPAAPGSISGSATVCAGSTGNVYSISPVANASSYNWTVPSGASITSGSGTASVTVTFGSNSGNVTVAAANGCGTSAAGTSAVTVSSPPATPGSITGSTSGISGSTGNVYSIGAVSNATSYTWAAPSGSTITAGQGSTSATITFGSSSGNITVTASNSCGTSSANSLFISLCSYTSGSQTFNFTGALQTLTVPTCVTSINIDARGAQGVDGHTTGGLGGRATGTLAVTPGQLINIYVGGSNSGWNGGGLGGQGRAGDASDVRVGGTALSDRVIVAGGGGGGCYGVGNGNGGAGGGDTGGVGTNSTINSSFTGGGGGTQSAGGSAGVGTDWPGLPGSLGQGAACSGGSAGAGGGGGGGYYGGGSGGSNVGSGGYKAGGGGGGSSYIGGVTGGSTTSGVQSGHGAITISW